MKKLLFTIILMFSVFVFAKANTLNKITMDIYLDHNGNAHIDEIWDMYTNDYTENYKPYYNLGESKITNFKVYDNTREYTYESNWNTKGTFSDKAYKNGFNYIDNGVEICWGISKYGNNSYHLSYDVSNMVINTSDGYGVFYWQLIPYDMNPSAASYDITIRTDVPLPDTIDVWGYGAYGKYAYVSDGVIKLVGEDGLNSDEYVVALAKFPAEMFETDYNTDKSFDDFLSMAEDGATHYKEKTNWLLSLVRVFLGFIPYIIGITLVALGIKNSGVNKYFKNLIYGDISNKLPKDYPMFRDIPCKKNIYAANYIAWAYNINKDEKNFIGCVILKWLKDGIIKIDASKGKGNDQTIILPSATLPDSYNGVEHEARLYKWMYEASDNGQLTTSNFKKYCRNHYNKILGWAPQNYEYGKSESLRLGYLRCYDSPKGKYNVNNSFYEEGVKIAGLKKFLVEFSDMKQKEPIEVMLWQDYLIFAQMFGIAKKVAKKFNDFYPEVYDQTDFNYTTFVFINDFSHTSYAAATSARSAAQSYSSGGGGFSSGGGGGGSFGGGGGGGGSR